MRAVIIEDESSARDTLQRMLDYYCPGVTVIGTGEDVETGERLIQQTAPDLVFLDIHLKNGTGFDLLARLQAHSFHLIFVTAYDKHALQAIKYSAIDYLLKPIDPDDLIAAVKKATTSHNRRLETAQLSSLRDILAQKRPTLITLSNEQGMFFIQLSEIIRLQSDGGITRFFCQNRKPITVSRTIGEFEKMLPDDAFFRIHQSHIVNLHWVEHFTFDEGGFVVMSDAARLPVARRRKDDFLQMINRLAI